MTWAYVTLLLVVLMRIALSGSWRSYPVFAVYLGCAALAAIIWDLSPNSIAVPWASVALLPVTTLAACEAWWKLVRWYSPNERWYIAMFGVSLATICVLLTFDMPIQWNITSQISLTRFRQLLHLGLSVALAASLIVMLVWRNTNAPHWRVRLHAWLFLGLLVARVAVYVRPATTAAEWADRSWWCQFALCCLLFLRFRFTGDPYEDRGSQLSTPENPA